MSPSVRLPRFVYPALCAALLLPFLLAGAPALIDYPNHLARLHVLANVDNDPALAENYQVVWGVMPNLAMDLFSFPLLGAVSAETLGLVFAGLTLLLLLAGTMALQRVLYGSIGLWPAAAFLFLYNHLLILGFLNYLFAVGLTMLLVAGWIASENRPVWIRLGLFPLALLGLYFAHIFALGFYGLCVAGYEISKAWPEIGSGLWKAVRKRFAAVWQFLPVVALMLATMPVGGERSFFYGPFLQKVKALWSPVLTYLTPLDLGIFLLVAAVLVAGIATRRLTFASHTKLAAILLVLAAVAMPFQMEGAWGYIWYADLRLPTAIALFLVAVMRPRNVGPKLLVSVTAAALVLFSARIYEISTEWRRVGEDFAEFRAALNVITPGAAILPVQVTDAPLPEGGSRFDHAYWHMPLMAVLDRSAFVPTLFTDPTKQPVRAAQSREHMDSYFGAPIELALLVDSATDGGTVSGGVGMQPFWKNWPDRYDYVLITHFGAGGNPLPDLLSPVSEGSFFDIYRITPPVGAETR